jgi:perosamine synthetase
VAVSSATAALHVALAAHGVGHGDEVIVPSLTFVSGPQTIHAVGARPVFCEVELETVNIDVEDAATRITPRTRAIMPVHYGGFPCRITELRQLAREHGIVVIEDAAHAFGSADGDRMIGSSGDSTCFSFDPVKNITCAEGGAITTSDDELARKLRLIRNLGIDRDSWSRRNVDQPWRYEALSAGLRYHLTDVHAAIGLAQLGRFEELRQRKRTLLHAYADGLRDVDGTSLVHGEIDRSFPFLCALRVADGRRDALLDWLRRDRIQAWVHFVPNHLQPAFADSAAVLPVTERLAGELITLPMFHELTLDDVERIVRSVRAFAAERA